MQLLAPRRRRPGSAGGGLGAPDHRAPRQRRRRARHAGELQCESRSRRRRPRRAGRARGTTSATWRGLGCRAAARWSSRSTRSVGSCAGARRPAEGRRRTRCLSCPRPPCRRRVPTCAAVVHGGARLTAGMTPRRAGVLRSSGVVGRDSRRRRRAGGRRARRGERAHRRRRRGRAPGRHRAVPEDDGVHRRRRRLHRALRGRRRRVGVLRERLGERGAVARRRSASPRCPRARRSRWNWSPPSDPDRTTEGAG